MKTLCIAAIDFGTTCTGYAYTVRQTETDGIGLNNIKIDQKWDGSADIGLQAPTTVLMTPDKKFSKFGFEAEKMYKTLTVKNQHKDYYYFRHFKMKLHHEKDLSRDMMLTGAGGKQMKAMTIFTEAIRYVKDHLLQKLVQNQGLDNIQEQISWVITVPAIWRESAKQFMREAAINAGIPENQLTLALEPESAAIYCKELALKKVGKQEVSLAKAFDPGEKYIVVDLGGGTVDTTGHEVQKNGQLKELHAATGGPWGGELVNEAFEEFMKDLVTKPVLDQFKDDNASAWISLEKEFERSKRSYSNQKDETLLACPVNLEDTYKGMTNKDLSDKLKQTEYKGRVELINHQFLLKPAVMDELFAKATTQINGHIKSLLEMKELKGSSTLLLVGGFSESRIVNQAVHDEFKGLRVIAPDNGGTAILKGAVMYGNDPNVIASRISPFTYGVHSRTKYVKDRHGRKPARRVGSGREVADNVFDKHLTAGQIVYVGQSNKSRAYNVSNLAIKEVYWDVYQSTREDPIYCDDPDCKFLGKLALRLPDKITDAKVKLCLSMTCRGSELEAKATVDKYNIVVAPRFDFLDVKAEDDNLIETVYEK